MPEKMESLPPPAAGGTEKTREPIKGLVSVGFATRNRAYCLRKAVDSILNQTYKNLELVISDNVSDDDTRKICLEYARKDPRVRYIRQERDIGSYENCNFTLREARGEFFMRADDDDFRPPRAIERTVAALNADREAVIAFGDFYALDPKIGQKIEYYPEKYFPFERGRYARVKRYLSFYPNEGKNLLLFGLWRRRVMGDSIMRSYYYGWDMNYLLRKLIDGPFAYAEGPFWVKGARPEPLKLSPPFRILRSLWHRLGKIFSRYFYVNMAIIAGAKELTLWEKTRLICRQIFMMSKLFYVRRA